MMQFIEYSLENHVARITINRPQVRNALNPETYYALSQVCDQVEQDDDVWLAVITGAGDKAFSAGRDLKQMQRSMPPLKQNNSGKLSCGRKLPA